MPRFPYNFGFNYPYGYIPYKNKTYKPFTNNYKNFHLDENNNDSQSTNCKQKDDFFNKDFKEKNKSNNNTSYTKNEDYIFDLFGIKLYFDDILILSLLFFLYKEEVKDYSLFIALLLLLIS